MDTSNLRRCSTIFFEIAWIRTRIVHHRSQYTRMSPVGTPGYDNVGNRVGRTGRTSRRK